MISAAAAVICGANCLFCSKYLGSKATNCLRIMARAALPERPIEWLRHSKSRGSIDSWATQIGGTVTTNPAAAAKMRPHAANWEAGLRMMNDHRVGLAIVVRNCVDCVKGVGQWLPDRTENFDHVVIARLHILPSDRNFSNGCVSEVSQHPRHVTAIKASPNCFG